MTAQESIDVFGQLVEIDDPALVTDQDREDFRADLKKFDAHLRRAENDAINLGRWIIDAKEKYGAKYKALVADERPDLGTSSAESLEALAKWERATPHLYEDWRRREGCTLSMRYELAKAANRALASCEDVSAALEDRYPEVFARRKGKLLDAGNGSASTSPSLSFAAHIAPGIATLFESGLLHAQEAERMYHFATASHPRAAQIIMQHGALNVEAATALDDIATRIEKNRRAGQQFADILAQADFGSIVLADGEQVPVYSATNREIASAYAKACKEQQISDPPADQGEKILKDEIDTALVIKIASLIEDETALTKLATMPKNRWFTLTVKTLPEAE